MTTEKMASDIGECLAFRANTPSFVRSIAIFALCFGPAVTSIFAQALTITPAASTLTIHPGDSNIPLNVTVGGGEITTPITVTITGLPSGITVSPVTLVAGGSGTLLMNASVAADQEQFPSNQNGIGLSAATTNVSVLAFAGSVQASASLALTVSLSNPAFAPVSTAINLPVVSINTSGVPVTQKDLDVPGTITITSADGQTSYLPGLAGSDSTAIFKVHGNSTADMPKLPYDVTLNTSIDLLSAMGLNCGYVTSAGAATCDKNGHYILLANYDDKTMLRDWAASALALAIPHVSPYLSIPAGSPNPSGTSTLDWWAPHSLFVEVFLNGTYQGTYQLIEKIEVDSHRVNIAKMAQTSTSGKALTGGYLLEIDAREDEDYVFTTPQGIPIGMLAPDFSPETTQQETYISNYVDTAENALFGVNFTSPKLGWRAYFDQTSLVDWYLVNDLMGNVDGGDFYSSDYLYKDENNPLLYMGPIWDFDISSGNTNYEAIESPTWPWVLTNAAWYQKLATDPGFMAAAAQQFNALKSSGTLTSWVNSIQAQAATLQQTQVNNFGRWPMQGIMVWPNAQAAGTYAGETAYLTAWLNLRIGYMDSVLNSKAPTTTTFSTPSTVYSVGAPVLLTAQVSGGTAPSGTVTFFNSLTIIGTAPLNSSSVATLSVSNLPVGTLPLLAAFNGDAVNALSVSDNIPVTIQPALLATTTNLATSATNIAFGTSLTLTAAVVSNAGSTPPTGSIAFFSSGAPLGTAPVDASGTANLTVATVPAGLATVTATYLGDPANQPSTANPVIVNVASVAPAITFTIPGHTYGDAPFTLAATSSSSAAITFSSVSGPASISGSLLTLTGAGPVTLQATQIGNGNYTGASQNVTFIVAPATLSASIIGNPSRSYNGTTVASLTPANYLLAGLVGTDQIAITQTLGTYAAATAGPEAVTANLASSFAVTSGSLTSYALPSSASGPGTITQPNAVLAAASTAFSTQTLGVPSAPLNFTLTNTGNAPLQITGISVTGTNATDFAQSTTCGASLAAGTACAISIIVTPTALGSRSATLAVTDNAAPSTQTAALSASSIPAGPLFSLAAGTYAAGQQLTLSTTAGQSIYYLVNGGAPVLYKTPLIISTTQSIQAYAALVSGATYIASLPITAAYTIVSTPAAPVLSLPAGTYYSAQQVTLTDATPGVSLYYTLNGGAAVAYTGPITVAATETIKAGAAFVTSDGKYLNSPAATAVYTIVPPPVSPVLSLAAGIYGSAQQVTITDATSGALIYVSINGGPTTMYKAPLTIAATETIQTGAYLVLPNGAYSSSTPVTATYTIVPSSGVPAPSH